MNEAEKTSYELVVRQAKKQGLSKALKELEYISPPYKSLQETMIQREWLIKLGGLFVEPKGINKLFMKSFLHSRNVYSLWDFIRFFKGQKTSINALWKEILL